MVSGERAPVRHAIEVDCRLDVLADVLALRVKSSTNRRAIVAAITSLLPTLREHAAHLDDTNDSAGGLPALLALEVQHLTA